jgi:hypothetical protein
LENKTIKKMDTEGLKKIAAKKTGKTKVIKLTIKIKNGIRDLFFDK